MGIFGNLFKKKEVLPPFDLGRFKADMHSHLIPGIDDGSQNMDQTIAMLAKFESLGYKKVVTTPHIMSDSFPNNRETIETGLKEVQKEIKKVGIKIEIEAAAEYYFDETLMPKIKNNLIDEIYQKRSFKRKMFYSLNSKIVGENYQTKIKKRETIFR